MLRFFVLACALGAIQAMIIPQETPWCGYQYHWPRNISSLIVGGIEAAPHSWPWQALILFEGFPWCGGTIIDKRWIVSAAHCFSYGTNRADYLFVVGAHNKYMDREYTFTAEKIHIHPDYSADTYENDIVLIQVDFPITFSNEISQACLVSERPQDGSMAYVTGWGAVRFGGYLGTRFLHQVGVPIVSDAACNASYKSDFQTPEMVCAGYPEGGKDSCQGDSGGPMVVRNEDTGLWELAGVVSWGYKCAEKGYYGVYANIVNYLDWIRRNRGY